MVGPRIGWLLLRSAGLRCHQTTDIYFFSKTIVGDIQAGIAVRSALGKRLP